jgi:signal transduction histidine kinase
VIRRLLHRFRASVFAKIMAIMLGLGMTIPVVVGTFFFSMLRPMHSADAVMLKTAHDRMLVALIILLFVIVSVAHLLIRRMLRPLRWLQEGVAQLGEGDLGVVVPQRTRDEFGVLTQTFNRMVERVREMVRSRDQLLLDVSHELRSPLTRMKVALALCPQDEHQRRLSSNVAEMEAMVTELLELERLRHGRGLRIEEHDLVGLLREMAGVFAERPPGVELGPCPERCTLAMDQEKIRAVLRNLLENATKYSLPDSRPVQVALIEDDQEISITVRDDGPGIPADFLPSLFQPFFRVDPSRSKKTGGYGLGLCLCKRTMEAHGGALAVANNEGRGATFVITFPR